MSYSKNFIEMKQYIRPQFLKKGDTVTVLAMASNPPESAKEERWVKVIESWGLKVKKGKHLYDAIPREFAGTDADIVIARLGEELFGTIAIPSII